MIASWISKIVSFVADAAGNDVMVHVQALSELRGSGTTDRTTEYVRSMYVVISHGVISQPIRLERYL